MSPRSRRIALALLAYGYTVAQVCDASTLPRRLVHQLAIADGMTWHPDSDTMRRPGRRLPAELADVLAGLTPLIDSLDDLATRREARQDLARLLARIDRALYPSGLTPEPTPAARPARKNATRKARTTKRTTTRK